MFSTELVLPSREEMRRRLVAVDDSACLQESFYPMLMMHAGERLFPAGVVVLLQVTIYTHEEGVPTKRAHSLYRRMGAFIDALIPDREQAKEAKEFLREFVGM